MPNHFLVQVILNNSHEVITSYCIDYSLNAHYIKDKLHFSTTSTFC